MMNCPYCKEVIADNSENCPHCKSEITKPCPFCREIIKADALKCKHCGSMVQADSLPQQPAINPPQNQVNSNPAQQVKFKSQTTAAILCAFLGGFGAHRFYLGPIWVGVIYLLLFWTGIPGLISCVEVLVIVFSSQATWARKHNNGVITPPAHIVIKILVACIPLLAIVGILAAIAIPQYAAFNTKAKNALAKSEIRNLKATLESKFADNNAYPDSVEASGYTAPPDITIKCSIDPVGYVCVSAHKKGTKLYITSNTDVKIDEQPYKSGEPVQVPYNPKL
jgi:TM2 domain-containing membrane protein YozV/Tfp pilus assembly protein PilE